MAREMREAASPTQVLPETTQTAPLQGDHAEHSEDDDDAT